MTQNLELRIVSAICEAQNETKNQILDIFLHEFICFLTSPIKVNGDFDDRVVDGVFQSKLNGKILEYRSNYVENNIKQSNLSKSKKIINFIYQIKKHDIIHFDPKIISIAKNYKNILSKHRYVTFKRNKVPANDFDFAINIIESYLTKHSVSVSVDWSPIKIYLTENFYEPEFFGPVVTGALTNALARSIAYKAEKLNIEHFVVMHGNMSSHVINEPAFQYAYHRKSTHLINYGEFRTEANYGSFHEVNPICELNSKVLKQPDITNCVYIPTTLCGFYTYGPYRAVSDARYLEIRSEIKRIFPGIKIKLHPKEKKEFTDIQSENVYGSINQALLDYELFVFDYVSTALFEVINTDKIIIFLDYNIRSLNNEFLEDLRKVVYYVPSCEISKFSLSNLCIEAPNLLMRGSFLRKYSGSHENLLKQVKDIING